MSARGPNVQQRTAAPSLTLSYAGFYGTSFEDFILKAGSLGFGGVQLIPDQRPNLLSELTEARTEKLHLVLQESGLRVSIHAPFYDLNLVSLVPEVQRFALGEIERAARLARRLGATLLTVHPGYMFPGWRSSEVQTENFWRAAKAGVEGLSNIASSNGLRVCVENGSYYLTTRTGTRRTPLHVGVTVAEMEALLPPSLDRLGVCLDLGKAEASEDGLAAFVERLGSRTLQVQVGSTAGLRSLDGMIEIGSIPRDVEIVFEGGPSRIKGLIVD